MHDGIDFDKNVIEKNLTLFLYPDDSDRAGQLLRIYQQYFMVSNAAQLILKEAKERADYVIIDTPPSDLMGDAIALTRYADAVLFVVKQNYGKLNNVIYAVESMKQTKAELIGFVLNGSYDKMNLLEYTSYGKYNKYAYSNRYYNKKITKPSENNEA